MVETYGLLIVAGLLQVGLVLALGGDAGLAAIACYLGLSGGVVWRLSGYGARTMLMAALIAGTFLLTGGGSVLMA